MDYRKAESQTIKLVTDHYVAAQAVQAYIMWAASHSFSILKVKRSSYTLITIWSVGPYFATGPEPSPTIWGPGAKYKKVVL